VTSEARQAPAVALDLSRTAESIGRVLYDLVALENFGPRVLEPETFPDDVWTAPYTPEEASLRVFPLYGRWFAAWQKLEVSPNLPEEERWELLRLEVDVQDPERLLYHEV